MSVEDRLIGLEQQARRQARTIRVQFAALIGLALLSACATRPDVRAQAGGWVQDAHGMMTYGAPVHFTGANADIVGARDSGLALLARQSSQSEHDPTDESFLIFGYAYPNGTFTKTMSFSNHWSYPPNPRDAREKVLLTRLFTVYAGNNPKQADENAGFMQCGGYGTVFYPDNAINGMECPGKNTVLLNGPVIANKDVHIVGRLFVNGVEIH